MDTSERICVVGSGQSLSDVIKYLGCEHNAELTLAIANILDRSIFKEMADEFMKMAEKFNSFLADMLRAGYPTPTKWYNPINLHNYRKMHRITPRRIVKRRDRQSRGSISLLRVERDDEEEIV